jgi:DNA helicase II / ATP-dependent DNA helicase PcrA
MTAMFQKEDIEGAFGIAPAKKVDLLDGLNPKQRKAVETLDGPVVIMAGAGTGKTTVLIRRTANLIQSGRARPGEILLVTFTKKAAAEMRERLGAVLGHDVARQLEVGNFHAICSQMLRRHAHRLGLPQRFTVLDDDGQKDVIAEIAQKMGLLGSKKDKVSIMEYLSQISSWKEDGLDAQQIKSAKDLSAISTGAKADDPEFLIRASKVFEGYQAELEGHKWCDFADLVLHTVRLFRAHPEIRDQEAGRFKYLMVDEFQDTSPVQAQWVTWMAKDHRNLCVVGDTDQSIYEWRNARPEIMMNFSKTWEGCAKITIDTNYRSSQEILDVANAVVAPLRVKDGLDKELTSPKRGDAPADFLRGYGSGYEEADEIADMVASKINGGTTPAEIAILCRSGMIITGIERALRERGLRYVVAGAMKFTDREEIKDAIAWLTLAANPMDYIAFTRVAGKPSRGLGPQKVGAVRSYMIGKKVSVRDAADALSREARKGSAAARTYGELRDLLDHIEMIIQNGSHVGGMLEDILDESGYWEWREENEKDPQCEQRMDNLKMIVEEAAGYARPIEFLEMISLQAGGDKGWMDDSVVVSTVHASKGLEFDIVFTPAMEEGVFPNARSEKTSYGADEERRLAHVAWTRARDELHISFAGYRMGGQGAGVPSRYLAEAGLMGAPANSAKSSGPRRLRPRKF